MQSVSPVQRTKPSFCTRRGEPQPKLWDAINMPQIPVNGTIPSAVGKTAKMLKYLSCYTLPVDLFLGTTPHKYFMLLKVRLNTFSDFGYRVNAQLRIAAVPSCSSGASATSLPGVCFQTSRFQIQEMSKMTMDAQYKDLCLIMVGPGSKADDLLARRRLTGGGRLAPILTNGENDTRIQVICQIPLPLDSCVTWQPPLAEHGISWFGKKQLISEIQ